ncbi:MAG: glycosyltransferase family 39 protein [bacterium]
MKVFHEIIEYRRRELLLIWGVFTLFIFSEFMFRVAHQGPYNLQIAWECVIGFITYMIGPWFLTFFLFINAYVIGRMFLGFAVRGIKFRTDLEETLFCSGTGFGLLSTATYIIGLSGLLYPFIFGIASIFIVASGYRHVAHLFRAIRHGFSPLKWDVLDGFLLVLLGLFILNTFLNPNNPATGYDSINSHLCAPKWYLRGHAIHFFPWINFNNFPQITEMLFTLQMMVFKDPGASVVYLNMLMIVGATWLIGSRYFGRKAALAAVVVLLINEKILYLGRLAMVEQILGFYVIMMLLSVLAWWESRDRRWLVLLGISSGLSC